jgi:hypothetical protein
MKALDKCERAHYDRICKFALLSLRGGGTLFCS